VKRFLAFAALTAALVFGVSAPALADVDDFEFESFDGQYTLSTDADGRSVLTTVETLVAVFPDEDQNRGIVRSLVDNYDGHPVDLEILSVTDENGASRSYETDSEDEFLNVEIAADTFVHGRQTYVITYTSHNVTRFYSDTGVDEFYWDINGTGWAQPFGSVTATVLTDETATQAAAYVGAEGSTTPATVEEIDGGYTFSATDLAPGENLTVAIGFPQGTFVPRDGSFFAAPYPSIGLAAAIGSLLVTALAARARRTTLADAPGRGTIVAQYSPPKDASLQLSALISHTVAKSTPAHIVALAVAGQLRILEVDGKKPSYRLEFVTADGANADDLEFLHALFGKDLTPGEDRSLEKADTSAAKRITKLQARVAKDAVTDGYRRKPSYAAIGWLLAASVVFAGIAFLFSVLSLAEAYGGAIPIAFLVTSIGALVATWVLASKSPLDARGVELRDYLEGLKVYISLAEVDRLRFLQSPDGALTTPIATDDTAQLVKLTERVLPYAMLFGLEKEWAKQLGSYYSDLGEQPTWYAGSSAFNSAVFVSSISSLSSSAASAYTGSSSTGGSGGGGASGGGGGGGGGGGV
jgi:uncharacterized membrane protein YgcG